MGRFDGVMILTDMDGTLLNSQRQLSQGNQEAARYFMEQGGLFSVATGRAKRAMEYFMPELTINAPAVLFNGSVVYDFEKNAPVWEKPLEENAAWDFARDMMERFPFLGFEVFLADGEFVARSNPITEKHFVSIRLPLVERPLEKIPQPWVKFNLTGEPEKMGPVAEYAQKQYGEEYFMQFSSPYFYEVMAKGANKGAGAETVCRIKGIHKGHLYTLGDNLNDKELMECAALSFAPENAAPAIQQIAGRILPHCDKDTLAAAVRVLEGIYPAKS